MYNHNSGTLETKEPNINLYTAAIVVVLFIIVATIIKRGSNEPAPNRYINLT